MDLEGLLAALDSETPKNLRGMKGWYATGPSELTLDGGICVIEECFSAVTLRPLRVDNWNDYGDLDLAIAAVRGHSWLHGVGIRLDGPLFAVRIYDAATA